MAANAAKALYPGSFDPVTLGHLDLIRRGAALFQELYVGVANNDAKSPLFSAEERVVLIRQEITDLPEVKVVSFRGLAVDFCRAHGIGVLLRGVRSVSDFEYEYQMALTNRALDPAIETVFVMPNEKYSYLSSRLIKEVYSGGGDLARFLTPAVREKLAARLRSRP